MANLVELEDEREEELESISSIWPELTRGEKSYTFTLELEVAPSAPIKLQFINNNGIGNANRQSNASHSGGQSLLTFTRLPSVHLSFKLPEGYPQLVPPHVSVSSSSEWLPVDQQQVWEDRMLQLWQDSCNSQVLFAYIDSIQCDIEAGINDSITLEVDANLRINLLDFQAAAEKADFNNGTFDCGVCLEPKKGSACYKMGRCGHIFCKECLVDFYNSCIHEGDIDRVQCMDFGCGYLSKGGKKIKPHIAPAELLQIPLDRTMVQRYADLRRKKKIEADKSVVYCPRKWCQAPARSDKYPMLTDLSLMTEVEEQSASTDIGPETKVDDNVADRLRICEKCAFAFCRVCKMSWHGDLKRCKSRDEAEISKDEQASIAYIRRHTSECPVCVAPVQKSMGCNHMTCFQCKTHFCYLCAAWLSPHNPYLHFNLEGRPCYQRLWDLEEGDNGEGNVEFLGARALEMQAHELDLGIIEL